MDQSIRVGIIGTGGMANHHADQFGKLAGAEVASCFDLRTDRARAYAARHGVARVAGSLEELLDQVDAVAIVTPDRFHAAPTLAALAAGKHVLCEKPLTVTLAEAVSVARAARAAAANGQQHMVNFSYRGSAGVQKAIELAQAGQLGALRHVHSTYLQSWLGADGWGNWTSESWLWRLQTATGSGGVLGDLGCHILDLTTAVAGGVRRIRCDLRTFPKSAPDGNTVTEWQGIPLDANDTAVISLEFDNGAFGVVQTTRWAAGHANSLRLEAHGTQGALVVDLDKNWHGIDLCLGDQRHQHKWRTETLPPTPTTWGRFVRAIQSGRPDQPDIIRGAQVQAYLDACERSARSGQWETVHAWV